MLALTGANRYYFVEGVTDMRLGQYRLCKVVETLLHRNPYNGDTFIFMSKDRRKTKIVRYEYGKYLLYVIALERDLKFMMKMFGCLRYSLYLCRRNEQKEVDNGRADALREQSEAVHRAESAD